MAGAADDRSLGDPPDLGVKRLHIDRRRGLRCRLGAKHPGCAFQQLILPLFDPIGVHIKLLGHNSASVLSPLRAASATFALKVGLWLRQVRFVMASPLGGEGAVRGLKNHLTLVSNFPEPALSPSYILADNGESTVFFSVKT